MTFIEQWRAKLAESLSEFARLAAEAQDIDFRTGVLAAGVLWPIREPVQDFDGEAIDAVRHIAGAGGKHILRAVQGWDADRLAAARSLAEAAAQNDDLAAALAALIEHFDAANTFAELLAPQLGDGSAQVVEQIKAALVNIGGIINIQSLNLQLSHEIEVPPPPPPNRPPEIVEFVGREAELAYFADKLASEHLAVITGMAGVGKTALAATLAEVWQARHMGQPVESRTSVTDTLIGAVLDRQAQAQGKVFWHAFHEGEGIMAIIWKLAAFLAWHGQEDLWQMLQSARQTGGRPPPPETLFDYAFQLIRSSGYLLCLDDAQFFEDDPLLSGFIDRLGELIRAGEVSLIITSRQMPDYIRAVKFEALGGLSLEDVRLLVAARGLSLTGEQVEELQADTGGNVQFLVMAIDALKRASNPGRVIARLTETDDIERFLLKEVDEGLTGEERAVMTAVAVLLGYPGTRDVIETLLDGENIRRTLRDLCDRYLLVVSEGEAGKAYGQNAIVRAFYYDLPGRRERQAMHRRAAAFYEVDEPDALRAALHYERAGEIEQAARLATADVRAFINQGQIPALRGLLERFKAGQLEPVLGAKVNIARSQVYYHLGQGQEAQAGLHQTLSDLAALAGSPQVRELKARVCRHLGGMLRSESPQEALACLERGLTELEQGESAVEAAVLHLYTGSVQIALGDYGAALSAVERGLALLPPGPSQWRIDGLINRGVIYGAQGDLKRGMADTQRALEFSRQLHDYVRMITILGNLGLDRYTTGDWAGAAADYRQAVDLAEQLGNKAQQAILSLNLGFMYTNMGDDAAALDHLTTGLELARQNNLRQFEAGCLSSLADLHLRRCDAPAAEPLLVEAERIALELGLKYQLQEIYRSWAQVRLAGGDAPAAQEDAERALDLTRELGMEHEEGMSLRVLGQVLLANGQPERALDAFEQSLALLADNPYEAALTRLSWGQYLHSRPDAARGGALLQEAQATFKALGARREVATVEDLLSAVPVLGG
ncbi:MAG: tetratricopeptide repeat protein, partial [Anaerolineae bacterium]